MEVQKRETENAPRKEKKPSSHARSSVSKPLTHRAGIFKIRGIGVGKETGRFSWRKHELDLQDGASSPVNR